MTLTQNASDDWSLIGTWSPNVAVGTYSLEYQVNGTGWQLYQVDNNVNSGPEIDLDPNGIASSGDFLEFRVEATDIGGCPDFTTNTVGAFVA